MKALVTGASGFIGAAVSRAVLEAGMEVRVLVRPTSNRQNLRGMNVETVSGDLQDPHSLRKALGGCHYLFHVAAHYALWDPNPSVFYRVNVDGTKNLLQVAADVGIQRIVYTSTIGAIGLPEGGGLGTEKTPLHASQLAGHYKRSKYLAEQEVLKMAKSGLPVTIVNPTAPIGEGDVKPTPTGQIIVDYLLGRMWAYIETGMNLIDVEDVAVGHVRALEKGRIGERYILGHRNLTFREICHILAQLTGIKAPKWRLPWRAVLPLAYINKWMADYLTHQAPRIPLEGVRMAKYNMHFDCSKALRELSLPQTPVEVSLEKAVKWFRHHGYA